MNQVERVTQLLKRLNAGEDPAKVKKEAQEFLASIDPEDLSLAEQQLIEVGLAPEDLRRLCSAHLEMLRGEAGTMKTEEEPGHVVSIMISEHQMILGFLDQLDALNEAIQGVESYDGERGEFQALRLVAEHLVGAEPHHQREEEVLFPQLEARGIFGPPQVMRVEHHDLRTRKEELKTLAENVASMDFDAFRRRLDAASKALVPTLREHIFKEDHILYPTALKVIKEPELWRDMALARDRIGYCCFTPEAQPMVTPGQA